MRLLRVLVIVVVGLMVVAGNLQAKHPPARDVAIPVYFGDPGDIYDASPRGRHWLEVLLDAGSDRVRSVELEMMQLFALFVRAELRSKCEGQMVGKAVDSESTAMGHLRSHGD